MSSSILKYGQIIRIRSYEKGNTFLTSKSYTDQNLYFQIYNKEDTIPSGATDVINVTNYRESLFQVLPTSSFEINDEMNSQKVEAKKAESAPRAKTEQQQFKAIISQKRGKGISFGDKVIFRHLDSQYYMYGSFDCASSGIGAFRIQLKKELSEKIIFQLMSYRTYEKEGDQMSLSAPFKVYHCETQCYVSYCFERLFLDSGTVKRNFIGSNKLHLRDKDFPVEAPKIKEAYYMEGEEALGQQGGQEHSSRVQQVVPSQARFLIINENIPKRVFKLVIHNQFQMKINKQKIRNHDIVYFIHTEKDQYMCPSNDTSQVFLKKRLGESDLTDIFDGLWEIEEIKTVEDKTDDILGRSKAPSRRTDVIKEASQKRFGNMNSLMPTAPNNLSHTYLMTTVGNLMVEGQVRAGYAGGADEVEEEGEKGNKKKDKFILRHLASGRIIYVSDDLKRVQLQTCSGHQKKPILLQSIDSKLQDGALVQFSFKTKDTSGVKPKIMKYFLGKIPDNEAKKQQQQQQQQITNTIREQRQFSEESIEQGGQQSENKIEIEYNSKFQKSRLGLSLDSSEHGFRIYKVSEQTKQLYLFVLSSQEILSKFSKLIGQYITLDELLQELNVFLLNNVIGVLKNLIGFIYNCEYSKIAESGNNPNSKKQRIFDELGMIELITRLLQQINHSDFPSEDIEYQSISRGVIRKEKLKNLEERNKNSQYRKVRTVYELGYKLLESVAASNDLMKIKISKYMSKYLNHILVKDNRTVYRSIQEFLDGNYLALEEIHENYIRDLISHIDENDPDPADLYFLSCLCLCKERTVTKNQVAVFRNFYSQNSGEEGDSKSMQQKLSANKFKFREDQQKMQILSRIIPSSNPQYRTLSQLFEECNLMKEEGDYDPDKNHWSYFLQYLNLLADICVLRNQSPVEYIKKSLPLKTLVAFLCESTVKKNLLFQPFIRLVHHAFVETSLYEEINRITKVKEWNQLGNFNIPKAKNPIPPDIKKTKEVIFNYIKRINKKAFDLKALKEKGVEKQKEKQKEKGGEEAKKDTLSEPETIDFNVDDRNRLVNVKTFLQILKSTLNLGFWPEIEEMKKMVPYLLKVMRFDIEYSNRVFMQTIDTDYKNEYSHLSRQQYQQLVYGRIKQQLKLNKPNIVLLVECKILAAKILNIIIDYEYNVRVSIITKYFKDVMEYDVNLSNYVYDKMKFIEKWKNHIEYRLFQPANEKEGYLLIDQLWKDKVDEILTQRDIFSECAAENINYTLVFFEAFVYSNQELTNLTLQLIRRVTSQREEILRTFKDIIFVAGGHLKNLAIRGVETTRSVLLSVTNPNVHEQSVRNNTLNLWSNRDKETRSQGLGVVQELASLTMSMMKSKANPTPFDAQNFYTSMELYPFFDIFKDIDRKTEDAQQLDGSYLIISQKDENLPLNQNLIKSQDHHLLIIDFIKLMSALPTNSPLPMRALHAAYNFLTALIWNNNQNKRELENILSIAECHLEYNVGCIDFYKQMYTNNKKLVKKGDIKNLIEKIIKYANNLSIKKYQKSKLMDFLRIAVIFDDEGYDINQNMVMELISEYQVSSKNKIVFLKAEEGISSSLSSTINESYELWISEYMRDYDIITLTYEPLDVSPQLCYVATFFEVFSALIENENVVNIGKASNMHPIDFLLNVLKQSGRCWIVVRHLRAYLNRLYYFQKRSKDSTLFSIFTEEDLPIIKSQLRGIVELIYNTPDYNIIRLKNPIRYCFLGSYVFLSLEEILHSLCLLFETEEYKGIIGMVLSQQTDKKCEKIFILLEIIEMLEFLLKTIDGRDINKYISRVSKELRKVVANTPFKIVEKYTNTSKEITLKNISDYKITSDEIPSKKAYIFHDGKGFWKHLIDWNSFKDQQIQREIYMNKVQKRVEPNPSETKEAEEQRMRNNYLDIIFLGNIDKKIQKIKAKNPKTAAADTKEAKEEEGKGQMSLHKNLTTSQSVRFRVKNERFTSEEDKNIVINQRRKKLVKFLEVNETFHGFTQEQVNRCLFDVFSELDTTSQLRYDNILVVGNAEVIRSIVNMNEIDPQSIRSEFKLLIIRLLTNFIQRKSSIFGEDIQKWLVDKSEGEKIKQPQDFLYGCGVASFLSSLIINDLRHSIEMGNAILMLGISLVLGKNASNQNEIFKLIKEDEKNLLISQLNNLIKDCGVSIATHQVNKETKEYNRLAINYSDTYDFYIDNEKIMRRQFMYVPETVEEQKEFDQKVVNMQYTFILLKNLCEGNNDIKGYIREQVMLEEESKIKPDSVNFLSLGVSELRRMFSNFNIDIIKVPISIIDFIYEVTQIPCLPNQLFICKSSLFSDFAMLERHITDIIDKKQLQTNVKNILIIFDLYSSNIKNVISCLEGNNTDIYSSLSSEQLCRYFVSVLAFYIKYLPFLQNVQEEIKSAADLQKLLNRKKLHESYYMNMFQATSVIVKLSKKATTRDFDENITFYIKKYNMIEIIELLKKNLLGIEIKMEPLEESADQIQTLFFPRHNVFRYLSRSTRKTIMEEVDRSTQRDKVIGLLSTKPAINEEIEYNYILDNQYKLFTMSFSITNAKIDYYLNLGLQIAGFICVLMLYFAAVVYYPYQDVIEYDMGTEYTILKGLSLIQFMVALMYFGLWMKNHMYLAIKKYQRLKAEAEQGQEVESAFLSLLFKIPGVKMAYCLKQDNEFGNMLLFMFGSVMGMFYSIEWFSILLVNLLMAHLEVLNNILQALKSSMRMLGMLSFFGASFIAFFSVFSLYYYVESIYPENHPKQHCESVLSCIIELYIKEQIGNDMEVFHAGRFMYDMIYVVFMDMLFGNIVAGVLTDKLASLRGEREQMLKDKTEKCFICGIDRQTLEKKSMDLKTHYTQSYHKLWNYVFYLYYLEHQTKKTGLEEIIEKKYQLEDVSWIPQNTSEENDMGDLLSKLQKLMNEQQQSMKAIELKE